MAEDANANIRIDIDTSEATAALKALQGQIARFHTEMARGGAAAGQVASKLQSNLVNSINAGGQFQAGMVKVQSTTEAFTTALEKNKLSMGQYFRYAAASTKTFGKFFGSEFQTITKVATERVKDLQTQYISMGRDANGALQSIKVRPLTLDMKSLTTQTMLATQKQQLYNQLLKQGSTNLLNFGKNTQWAGRQLMVGFTIPLTMFAAAAAKSFMDIEKQIIKIRRVYGDFSTTVQQTDEMIKSIRTLASEYTKYGVAVKDTIGLASDAAAAGKTGQELLAQVSEATRLAVLGNVSQTQALETTMSVTNAFGVATQDLANKIDFLNAVENQSVTSIEDLTIAIPKAGPVVQQLGGDVEDLAFFLTAMKEGGINASEGANALKSGLAALINPTGKAKEMLQGFGINIEKIVNSNKGDVKGLVLDFSAALDTLDPLNRARAIEQLFGKFQFSRLSTLFQNVIGEGTQAARVLELTKATTQELAILSQRELKRVEDTTTYKFEKAFADFQNALAPVGEEFLKVVTPIIEFGTKLLQQFNSMGDGAKAFTVILTTVVAGIGPALLMTVGLVANGVANLIKMFSVIGNLFNKTGGDAANLGLSTEYMTQQQIEAAAVAASLGQSHSRLTQIFSVEAAALNSLTLAYQKAITAQQGFGIGGGKVPGSATKPKKYATGGVVRGPGTGTSDSIPAMLSNGEAVIPAKQAKKYSGFISQMISGNVPGFFGGVMLPQKLGKTIKTRKEYEAPAEEANAGYLQSSLAGREPEQYLRQHSGSGGHSFEPFGVGGAYIKPDGTPVMVKPVQNEQLARAEIFGTRIAREAHGLQAPEQRLVVIQDPTDLTGQRRFLALESAYDQTFVAPEQQSFTKGQFFKQLVASLVRNDKDLQSANLWGNVIADVGPAGVFAKASGVRSLTADLPSMQQQAMINLLGVKGGARKDFALATADIARGLSPADYARGITREIDEVLPRLKSTINSFDLNPQEKVAYQAMIARLEAGRNTDWTQMQSVHAAAMPTAPKAQGFARGGFVGKKPPITTTDKKPTPGSRIPAEAYDFDDTLIDFGQYLTTSREANKKLPWKDRVKWWSDEELRGAINVAHPMPKVIEQLKKSQQAGKQIIVLTARPSSADGITREHLAALGIDPTNIKIVSRNRLDPEMAALKAPELKNKLASQLINDYDIEAFYDDLLENRKALSVLGIKTFDPLKMAKGGMIPGYANGVVSVPGPKGKGDVVPAMLSPGEAVIPAAMAKKYGGLINGMIAGNIPGYRKGFQESHMGGDLDITDPKIIDQIEARYPGFKALTPEQQSLVAAKGNLTATLPNWMNQAMRESSSGIDPDDFENEWNKYKGKLGKAAVVAGVDVASEATRAIVQGFEDGIGQEAARLARLEGTPVFDRHLDAAAESILTRAEASTDVAVADAAKKLKAQRSVVGTIRSNLPKLPGETDDAALKRLYNEGKLTAREKGMYLGDTDLQVGRDALPGSSSKNATPQQRALRQQAELARAQHYAAGGDPNTKPVTMRGASISSGSMSVGRTIRSYESVSDAEVDSSGMPFQVLEENKVQNNKTGAEIASQSAKDVADGAAAQAEVQSPSRVTRKIGQDTAQGYIDGVQSGVAKAKKAGRTSGRRVTMDTGGPIVVHETGTQAVPTATRKRKPGRATREQGPAGPARQTINGVPYPVAFSPAPGISETPIGPMTEKEYKKQEFERKHPKISKATGSIARFARGPGMMAASMAGMPLMMIPGLETMGMAVSVLGPMLMMLPGPIMGVVAALAGMVGIVMALNAAQEEQRKKAIELAEAQVMSIDALKTMSEDFGTVSATEAAQAKEDAKAAGVTGKQLTAGEQYLTEMVSGQQIVQDVKTQQAAGMTASEIGKNVAANMATAVAQGVITTDQADAIIAALGKLSGDRAITAGASEQFRTYTEDPTQISGMVAQDRLTQLQGQFATASKTTTVATGKGAVTTMADSNAALGAVAGTMSAYGQAEGGIDAINAQYDALVKEATTRKEINDLEIKRTADLTAQRDLSAATYSELEKQKSTIGAVKFNDAFLKSFEPDSDMFKTAQKINDIEDSEFKTRFQADFAGGNISQATAESIIGAADKGAALKAYYTLKANVSISKQDAAMLNRLQEQYGITPAAEDKKPKKKKNTGDDEDTGGGGGGGEPEDAKLTALSNKLDKRQKAMAVISLREAAINKKYDERKKALEDIARINGQISEQQKSQLDIANALASGDIAAAARAVQAERARAAAFAQEQQIKALDEQKKSEIDNLSIGGKSKNSLQDIIDKLYMQIAMREYKTASSGGMMKGYSVGGKVMSYFADGGQPLGSDTIPAMLTPGEFVIKRPAVQNFGVKRLEAINSGKSSDSSVYTYNVSVNVATNSDPDAIARTVVTKIRSIDKQRLGGNSY